MFVRFGDWIRYHLRWPLLAGLVGSFCLPLTAQTTVGAYEEVVASRRFDVASGLDPLWMFQAGMVYLDRATEDSRVLMFNTADLTEQLNADDFDFDWTAGLEAQLVRRWWDNDGVEFRYLDSSQFDAVVGLPTTALSLQLNASPPIFVPNVQSIDSRFESDLFSIEANYHYWLDDSVTALAGIRYVALDDDLTVALDAGAQNFAYAASTRNDLYGAHVGILLGPRPCRGCFFVSASAKIGVFGNDAQHNAIFDTGAAVLRIRESADNLSWVGEVGVNGQLPITQHLSLSVGYGLLWIDQVAIASDQLPASDFFNGIGHGEKGTALFHGANLAVQLQH